MAHSRFALTTMYDWIEARVTAGEPTPTDTEICERFSFDSPESARTLLAELADAGRITIKGYGDTRTVTLSRQRHALEPVERPVPTVAKADPVVDATTARIAEILNRGRKSARAVVAENASKLLSTVTSPAAPAAAQPAKEPVMAGKSFMLPATATSAIAAIEALAKSDDISLGHAAAVLIGGLTYYALNGHYYQRQEDNTYVVVQPPSEPVSGEMHALDYNGERFYVEEGHYYRRDIDGRYLEVPRPPGL